jgi:hypothetical protein
MHTPQKCAWKTRAESLIIAKKYKQQKCLPTNEWIKKMWCSHTMEYYSAINRMSHATTWMNTENIWSQKGQMLHDLTYMIYLR